jgi:uncharacterized membrane protein
MEMQIKSASGKAAARHVCAAFAVAVFVAAAIFFSANTSYYHLYRSSGSARVSYEKARVLAIEREDITRDAEHGGMPSGYQDILVRITTGDKAGTVTHIENVLNYTNSFLLQKGQGIIIHEDEADAEHFLLSVYSVDRTPYLALLGFLFVAALCGVGGRRGFRSLLGMAFTFSGIVFIFIPLLYRGVSPSLAAAFIAALTIAVSLLLLDGPSIKSFSAIAGSIAGLAVSSALAYVFQRLTQVSGFTTPEADSLLAIAGKTGMRVGELLFAAFLISTLGAEMDISISVASTVAEVHAGNAELGRKELFRAGMNVGRDMMGTMANTLILAFAGSSLNAIILIYSIERSFNQIVNSNTVAIEIVQSLTAGLAVIFTVPAVAFIAAGLLARKALQRVGSMHHENRPQPALPALPR